ncbi:MAG: HAD family hydrolase [Burkholderiales bacterium PBB1]|nr:MAG: HAD family hydrolase [Burkholderiales bacterium PBB1]
MTAPLSPSDIARSTVASRAAVFIDKDGTLLDEGSRTTQPAPLRFQPGALECLTALAAKGLALIVVTNQSGLSMGHVTRREFSQRQAALERQLVEAAGIALTDFVVCPHTPAPDGQPACLCRTPAPGLLIRAARAHRIDLAASWMVGDTLDDIEAGRRAGCRTLLLNTGRETQWRRSPLRTPHARCTHWDAVTPLILASGNDLCAPDESNAAAAG